MWRHYFFVFFISFLLLASAYAQDKKRMSVPVLVDQFGKSSGEERSATFDNFFIQLSNIPESRGYIFIFCGKLCSYGEVEAHVRGIELKTATARFSRERLIVLHGGFRDAQEVELWLAPVGAAPPVPKSTRSIKDVTFSKTPHHLIVPYDCCEDDGLLWKKFRPKSKGQKVTIRQ